MTNLRLFLGIALLFALPAHASESKAPLSPLAELLAQAQRNAQRKNTAWKEETPRLPPISRSHVHEYQGASQVGASGYTPLYFPALSSSRGAPPLSATLAGSPPSSSRSHAASQFSEQVSSKSRRRKPLLLTREELTALVTEAKAQATPSEDAHSLLSQCPPVMVRQGPRTRQDRASVTWTPSECDKILAAQQAVQQSVASSSLAAGPTHLSNQSPLYGPPVGIGGRRVLRLAGGGHQPSALSSRAHGASERQPAPPPKRHLGLGRAPSEIEIRL